MKVVVFFILIFCFLPFQARCFSLKYPCIYLTVESVVYDGNDDMVTSHLSDTHFVKEHNKLSLSLSLSLSLLYYYSTNLVPSNFIYQHVSIF